MSDGMWTYAWWEIYRQRLKDAQWDDWPVGRIADQSYREAQQTMRAFKSFCQCCAVAGALMAAEDRGYKSGYRTGYEHGRSAGTGRTWRTQENGVMYEED